MLFNNEKSKAKFVRESCVETRELILPADLNTYGTLFGGRLISYIDKIAGIAAYHHSGLKVVTAGIDSLSFIYPAKKGNILTLRASVNRVFNTSMEIGVLVTTWDPETEEEHRICPAYLTFVGLNNLGRSTKIRPVLPETEDEKRRYKNAGFRRAARLELLKKLNQNPKNNS